MSRRARTTPFLAIIYLTIMVGLHQTLNLFIDLILTVGGMDLYVRQFGLQTHDQFYTDPSILTAFMNYTTQVVSRYVNSPSVFSYELANDPRYVMAYLAGPLSLMHFIQMQLYLASICYLYDRNDHDLACDDSFAHPQH
jgi:endo-1,4-beta-mannosidase